MLETNFSGDILKNHKWTRIKEEQQISEFIKIQKDTKNMLENKPSKHHKDCTYLYIKR